jgi:hypothetical protein
VSLTDRIFFDEKRNHKTDGLIFTPEKSSYRRVCVRACMSMIVAHAQTDKRSARAEVEICRSPLGRLEDEVRPAQTKVDSGASATVGARVAVDTGTRSARVAPMATTSSAATSI